MPTLAIVETFVGLVEAGQGIDALDRFYADGASMQENQAKPRAGKATLLAHEAASLAAVTNLNARCVRPILVSGDTVVIRWVFEYVAAGGHEMRLEEIAHQRWAGDQIVEEQFFYDPSQIQSRGAVG